MPSSRGHSPDPTPDPGPRRGPDAIWAPWRLQYLESIDDAAPSERGPGASPGSENRGGRADRKPPAPEPCFLADYWASPDRDREHHVLHRTAHGMILLNGFPYSNGHLLVALGHGRPRLLDYTAEQRAQLWSLVDLAADLVERTLEPQGVNIGINQGRAAGAGIPGHLHAHLVPRWGGDVNFISTIGQIRVIPSSLEAMADRYRKTISTMNL